MKQEQDIVVSEITTEVYSAARHRTLWDGFVDRSMNGTVFHKQNFLEYHSPDKFQFEHLLFFCGRELRAVLPGGRRSDGSVYESPLGASYGSFVTGDIDADTALGIVAAFEQYIASEDIREVYLTSAPVIYQPVLTQNLDFALLYKGYAYQRHYISHCIELRDELPFNRFQSTARKHIRRTYRTYPNIRVESVPSGEVARGLREFYPILVENKAKYNAKPTHTLEELLRLNELVPDLMQLFLVRLDDEPIAGSLIFKANKQTALIFYHMMRYSFNAYRPIYLLMDAVTRWAQESGYRFVDIGVSQDTSDDNPMTPALSLIRFKEKFDSRGVLRSTMYKRYSS